MRFSIKDSHKVQTHDGFHKGRFRPTRVARSTLQNKIIPTLILPPALVYTAAQTRLPPIVAPMALFPFGSTHSQWSESRFAGSTFIDANVVFHPTCKVFSHNRQFSPRRPLPTISVSLRGRMQCRDLHDCLVPYLTPAMRTYLEDTCQSLLPTRPSQKTSHERFMNSPVVNNRARRIITFTYATYSCHFLQSCQQRKRLAPNRMKKLITSQ